MEGWCLLALKVLLYTCGAVFGGLCVAFGIGLLLADPASAATQGSPSGLGSLVSNVSGTVSGTAGPSTGSVPAVTRAASPVTSAASPAATAASHVTSAPSGAPRP